MNRKLLSALAIFALAAPLARGASDFLLELDGIKGESSDSSHPGTIEIESFSWGATNTGATGGGGGAGKVSLQDFHFITRTSAASPQLLMACATGKPIPKAVLYVRKSGSDTQYLEITLTDVLVSSYSNSTGGTPGATPTTTSPGDSVRISFTGVRMRHTADDGTTTTGSGGTAVPPAQ